MNRMLRVPPVAEISSVVAGGELVAFNVGADGTAYIVIALAPLDYSAVGTGRAVFPKTMPDHPQTYRVIALSPDRPVLDVKIEQEPFNIHHIQPLGDDLLLVCARSHYK